MFIRKKRIKNSEYAYLVSSEWTPLGPRQKVSKYIGKIVYINVKGIPSFSADMDSFFSRAEIISYIIEQNLLFCGFQKEGNLLKNEKIHLDIKERKIISSKRTLVLSLNEGFLCKDSIDQLFDFQERGDSDVGKKLATLLVNAGLVVPKEVFVSLYEKFYS